MTYSTAFLLAQTGQIYKFPTNISTGPDANKQIKNIYFIIFFIKSMWIHTNHL